MIYPLSLNVMPDLIPANKGIFDRHPGAQEDELLWIPDQARNDKGAKFVGQSDANQS